MIKTINDLLDTIEELEHKETPIYYIYYFLGGKEKLEFPKEWMVLDSLTEEIEPRLLSKPPQNMVLRHFIKDKATIPKIKLLLEQHIGHGIREPFLIISLVLAVDLVLKFYAFGYRDGLAKRRQLLAEFREDLNRVKEGQKPKKARDEEQLRALIGSLEKICDYDKEKGEEAARARDYVLWAKLTGLDNGIDFFHDYYDLPTDPTES